jgi:hypothetical protein
MRHGGERVVEREALGEECDTRWQLLAQGQGGARAEEDASRGRAG